MIDIQRVARHYGGDVNGGQALIPGIGHSKADRSVAIKAEPSAPDGCLVCCHGSGDPLAEKDRLRADGFLPKFEPTQPQQRLIAPQQWFQTAAFNYTDLDGVVRYRVVREETAAGDKRFKFQHPDGNGGWRPQRGGPSIPYRWGELERAAPHEKLYLAEGQAKADKLASWGLLASSHKGFPFEYASLFADRDVVILPDNDETGFAQARDAAAVVERGGGRALILPPFANVGPGGDILDWDGDRAALEALEAATLASGDNLLSIEPDLPAPGALSINATPYQWREPHEIPARQWLFGKLALRGAVTMVAAPGATGKSALFAGVALSLASGREFLRWSVWGGAKRVWLWNLEDSRDELSRSLSACCRLWSVGPQHIDGRLFVDSALDGSPLCTATMTANGAHVVEPVVAALIAEVRARQIDMLIIDPFVSSHQVSENDNMAMDAVAKSWARVAKDADCSVVLIHHTRKLNGTDATVDSARGANALANAARAGIVLNQMDKGSAEQFGIEETDRRRFFRVDDAKPNRAPPAEARWFELVGVDLGNSGPAGSDNMAAVQPWTPPDAFAGIAPSDLVTVQAAVTEAAGRDENRANVQSGASWVGYAIGAALSIDPEKERKRLNRLIAEWVRNGVLERSTAIDKKRNARPVIVAGKPVET